MRRIRETKKLLVVEDFNNQQNTGVPSGGGAQLPGQPPSLGASEESAQPVAVRRKWHVPQLGLLLRIGGIGLLALLLIGGGLFALSQRNKQNVRSLLSSRDVNQEFNALQLPLDELVTEGALSLGGQNRTLTINGQLRANNTLVIAPTTQPSRAVTGQIYFDQGTNELAYFNGVTFVPLTNEETPQNVQSLGGASGTIGVGGGLLLVGGALSNAGVLSVQGVSGAVTLAGGNGISVNGTTIANIGVLSLGGQTGDVTVGAGLSASGGEIRNNGVVSLTAGTVNLLISNDGAGNLTISSVGGGAGTVASSGGTVGRIAKFTASQNIEDSLLSEAAGTVTANGNFSVTGNLSLGIALSVADGGTGSTTAPGARTNLGAAARGANSDITSLSGLTTALSVVQGGTGAASLTANGVLLGNGTGAISSLVAGGAGLCLMSNAGAPSWQACPGGGGVTSLNSATGALSIANATQAGGVITLNNASTSGKGIAQFNATNFTVTAGIVNTIQNIDPTANPTFAGINTSAVTPNGTPLVVGSTTEDLTLQGTNTLISEVNGVNTSSLAFVSPTANVTYRLQTAAAGTYDVCTTVGNCVGIGGSVSTSGGTNNRLAKFTGSQTLGDSLISDNGTLVTIGGNLSVTGTVTLTTPLAVTQGGTGATSAPGARTNLGAAASGANNDITSLSGLTTALTVVQGGTGATNLTANGILLGNGTSPVSSLVAGGSGLCLVSTAGAPSWQSCPGGGGVTSVNGQTGALTIANASGAGGTITINDATTSAKGIASFNSTNFSVSSGAVNTIQNINIAATPTFGALTLSSSQATSPMLLVNNTNAGATGNLIDLQLNGASRLAVTPAGNMTLSGTVNGQTISSTANFTGSMAVAGAANLNGGASVTGTLNANTITPTGAMTIGATAQNLTLQGATTNITATNAGSTTSLAFQTPTANVTYRLQTAAAGTYDICTSVGNCAGVGGGVTTPGGTTNRLAKFTGSQTLGDSIITDNGSTVTIGGALSTNTITPTGAMTIGATGQNLTLQGADVSLSETDGGITNSLVFATPSSSNKTITIPNATGTVAVSASGPLQLDSSGNITCPLCVTSGGGGGGTGAVDSLNALSGALTLANATGAGNTITIDNASTSGKGIAQFNSTNFSAASGLVNTIQDINTTAAPTFGRLSVTSSQATNDMLVVNNTNASGTGALLKLQLNGANRFSVDPAGNVVTAGTITSGTINGQTISSSANFTGSLAVAGAANLNGGAAVTGTLTANTITSTAAMTVGNTTQNLTLQGAVTSITSTNAGNTTALNFQTPTANVTYRLLTAAAGTYDVCTTAGNCAGLGGAVTTTGGTINAIPKFTSGQAISDSNISDDGSTVTIGVDLTVNTITPTAAMTIGAIGQDLTLQGANVALTETNGGITNTLGFATPSGSNKTITIPNASGTVAVSASGPLAIDASGNITCASCLTSGVTSLNSQTGAVTLANASGAGGTVTINDASTSQKGIAQFNSTNFSASSGTVNTIQDINTTAAPTFGKLTVTSNQASDDMLVINNTNTGASGSLLKVQLNGGNRFTVDGAGNIVVAGTITSQNINGQTISSAANFTGSVAVGTSLTASTSLLSPLLDTANAVALNIGTTNATVINLNENTTVASGKSLVLGGNLSMQPAADSTTLIDVDTQGGANLLTVDSTNGRVGINKGGSTLPAYSLDVTGDINSTTGYRVGGTAGSSVTCSGGQLLQNLVAVGGILTGGSCVAAAGTATLQTAYTASTGSTTPEVKLDATRGALDIQDADSTLGANLLNVRGANGAGLGTLLFGVESDGDVAIGPSSATARLHVSAATGDLLKVTDSTATAADVFIVANEGATTFQNRTNSTSAFRVLSSGSGNIFNIDSTNERVGIGGVASFSKFEVIGGDAAVYNSGNNPRLILGDSTAGGQNGYLQWDSTNDYFRIESVGTNGLKINDNYVAIGNLFPDQPLKIGNGSTLLAQINTTGQAMYQNSSNSTAAFRVITSGGGNVFSVDTSNGRVGINLGGTNAPAYALDVSGDTNTTGVYRVGGTAGISATCTGGQVLQNLVSTGGIVTGGSCGSSSSTLQQAYTASTGGTTPEIKLDSTRGALDIQDADSTIGGALLNVRASNGSGLGAALLSVGNTGAVTLQNSTNSSNTFLIKNAAGNSLLNFDTTTVNLISNASLETDASGWVAQTGNTAGDPTISRVTTQAATGAASLQIVTNADINEGARIPVTLSASTQYTVSFYVKGLSSFSTLSVGRSDNGTPIDCGTGNSVSSTQWNRYDCTFTTGGTISSSYVYVRQSDATIRTFWVDGMQVQTGSSASPYQEGKASLQGGLVINALNSSTTSDYGLTVMGTGQLGLGTERLFAVRNKNGQSAIEYAEQVSRTIIYGGSSFWGTAALEVAASAADSQGIHLKAFSGQTADMLRLVSSAGGNPVRWAVGAGDYTDTSGIKIFNEIKPNFNPTSSSTASFTGLAVNPIINFAAGGAGNSTALLVNPTYTAAPSGNNLLADFQNGGVSVLKVNRTGAITAKNSTDSIAAFEVLTTSNSPIFTVDTSNSRAYIGSTGANSEGILLVLDSMTNSTEPTGVNGGMYYNASMSRMRCYVEGMWRFCNDPPGLRWGYSFEEDFLGDVDIGIGWSTLTGGGTVTPSPPDVAQRPGQYQLSTGTGTTGYSSLSVGGGDLGQFFIKGGEEMEFAVKIPTLSTSGQEFDVRAGLCDTVGSCFLGLYVEYDRNSSVNWRFGATSNTTGSENASSKAVATGWTTFRIVALSSTSVDFYAKHESESSYTLLGNITNATDIPNNVASATFPMFHIQKSAGTTARTINVDYFNIRNSLTDAR